MLRNSRLAQATYEEKQKTNTQNQQRAKTIQLEEHLPNMLGTMLPSPGPHKILQLAQTHTHYSNSGCGQDYQKFKVSHTRS